MPNFLAGREELQERPFVSRCGATTPNFENKLRVDSRGSTPPAGLPGWSGVWKPERTTKDLATGRLARPERCFLTTARCDSTFIPRTRPSLRCGVSSKQRSGQASWLVAKTELWLRLCCAVETEPTFIRVGKPRFTLLRTLYRQAAT